MNSDIIEINGVKIAEITSKEIIIRNAQEALELLVNFKYQGVDNLIMYEENLIPSFFDLKSGVAGEILQKFSNYDAYLSIIGDFSKYNSKSLQDFIFESNKQGRVVFARTKEEVLKRLFLNG